MRTIACGVALTTLAALALAQEPAAGRKFALLVGVRDYRGTELSDLKYTENDVTRLADVLRPECRRVVLLTRTAAREKDDDALRPNAENIRLYLKEFLGDRKPEDSVVVAFAGHGIVLRGKADELFFCPERADLKKPDTLVSLDEVYQALAACPARVKLLIVDACRNDPFAGRAGRPSVEVESISRPLLPKPPAGVAALFSCGQGQKAFESDKLQHGIFFHHLIEGLKGKAANRHGEVDLLGLARYVQDEVPETVKEERGEAFKQDPEPKLSIEGHVVLLARSGEQGRVSAPSAPKADRPTAPPPPESARTSTPSPPDPARASAPSAPDPARVASPSSTDKLDLGGGVTLDLVQIPAGSFTMGSSASDKDASDDEKPAHTVLISQPFFLGKTEVTVGQFQRFVADAGYTTEAEADGQGSYGYDANGKWGKKPEFTWKNPGWPQTDAHPVVCVSWNDATRFCEWLSRKTGRKVVLPSEAHWEYSCRARSTAKFSFGDDADQLGEHAWFTTNTKNTGTRAVATRKPNAFGLYDMHGNVREWCRDGKRTYSNRTETDPEGDADFLFGLRSGSFLHPPPNCRAASRLHIIPDFRSIDMGFRVAVRP